MDRARPSPGGSVIDAIKKPGDLGLAADCDRGLSALRRLLLSTLWATN
jgi:hypothetical protein